MKILDEVSLWQVFRAAFHGRNRDADLRYLVAVWQISVRQPVMPHDEQGT